MSKKKNDILEDIRKNITDEDRAKFRKEFEESIKWMEDHPDYDQRYGTDKSYWLQEIKDVGFNPIAITSIMGASEQLQHNHLK